MQRSRKAEPKRASAIPVSIHSGDPEAFFHPTDASNERYEELTEHPDWSFYSPQYPRLEELLAEFPHLKPEHIRAAMLFAADVLTMDA